MMEKLGQAKTHLELKKMMRRWTKLTRVREGRRRIEKKILTPASLVPRPLGRNSLATYTSSNCYFHCQRVGGTNQISDRYHMKSVTELCHALKCRSVGALHDDFCLFVFCLPSVAEPVQTVVSTSSVLSWWNYRGLHCLNEVCSCHDVTSLYSLNSRKLPGRFTYTAWEPRYTPAS